MPRQLRTTEFRPAVRRRRLAGVCLLAATALTVVVPVRAVGAITTSSPVAASTTAVPVAWGDGGWGDGSWGDRAGGAQTATVDSDPATADESAGVVLIDTVLTDGQGAGTGMVLTSTGEVLTNYHVVEGATRVSVTVASTGQTYDATVVGHDASADVALLQLEDAAELTTVTLDDGSVAVGDRVTAVGNAGGTGTLTAADGTVTALKATITTASEGSIEGETLTSLIETDADVVAGDSGGPLIDEDGEVVGIDTAASTGSAIDGYAIPIDRALSVVRQIRTGEPTSTVSIGAAGYLGVELAAGSPSSEDAGWGQDTISDSGALIAGVVTGEAAAEAGLDAGDMITAVDGQTIYSAEDLSTAIGEHAAGDTITVHWLDTSGAEQTAKITLGASPTA